MVKLCMPALGIVMVEKLAKDPESQTTVEKTDDVTVTTQVAA
jgi:hypothetical protein